MEAPPGRRRGAVRKPEGPLSNLRALPVGGDVFGVALDEIWAFFTAMRCCGLVIAFLVGWGSAAAAEPATPPVSLDSLVKNSPFGSAASQNVAGAASGPLEFRGMMVDKGETFFSFFEPATRTSQWVGLKEESAPYTVQSYDNESQTVKVLYHNQPLSLTLKRSQIIVQAMPVVGPGPVATATGAPQVAPASADEAARLAQVAEEIRRRRALRSQGVSQLSGPQPANPPGPDPRQTVSTKIGKPPPSRQ